MERIYLAGGCFWGLQKFFDQFEGVERTEVGYANGPDAAPSYQEVCASSGHAETVLVEYDEKKIGLEKLLDYYFMVIDPPNSTLHPTFFNSLGRTTLNLKIYSQISYSFISVLFQHLKWET